MERTLTLTEMETTASVFGSFDKNLKLIEEKFDVAVSNRGDQLKITGAQENTQKAEKTIENLLRIAKTGEINEQNVRYVISLVDEGYKDEFIELSGNNVCVTAKGKAIKAKTIGQAKYVEAIARNTVVFGIGPAGTGKTYLAVASAVTALRNKAVSRIMLTRPAVEAGEKLGFLPGDLQTKVDPYLRPLHDALHDMLGVETYEKYVERGVIEIAPLAYMRGRTLDDSFIILDEAQNTTSEQMKMFLTRIGFSSKAVVTGDITQIDLPEGKRSGLIEVTKILTGIDGIHFSYLSEKDVVRHHLVQKIITAYEKYKAVPKDNKRSIRGRKF